MNHRSIGSVWESIPATDLLGQSKHAWRDMSRWLANISTAKTFRVSLQALWCLCLLLQPDNFGYAVASPRESRDWFIEHLICSSRFHQTHKHHQTFHQFLTFCSIKALSDLVISMVFSPWFNMFQASLISLSIIKPQKGSSWPCSTRLSMISASFSRTCCSFLDKPGRW